ncbi:MAG: queuosine salvage family protein [Solirubrobacteraceae bacterium]
MRIEKEAIAAYAESLQPVALVPATDRAFSLQLNAINFGSGWFPTLRKLPGLSGFRTVEAQFREHAAFSPEQLAGMDQTLIARTLNQDPNHPLMALYAKALNEIAGVEPHGDAVQIAEQLAELPTWHDPGFFKRAQIAAADLTTENVGRLTIFADNLVPHVLKLDGILSFAPDLDARIDREELLGHGSAEEVEIRACAVHAAELLVAAHGATTAARLDHLLWNRGAQARYKARPRHRARTTAY